MIVLWFMRRGARKKLQLSLEEQQWWEKAISAEMRRKRVTDALYALGMSVGPFLYAFFERPSHQLRPSDVPFEAGMFLLMYGLRRVMSGGELESRVPELLTAHRVRQELLLPEPAPAAAARSLDGDYVT